MFFYIKDKFLSARLNAECRMIKINLSTKKELINESPS